MSSVLLAVLEGTGGARHCRGIARALRSRGHEVVVVGPHGTTDAYRRLGCEVQEVPAAPAHLARELTTADRRIGRLLANVVRQVVEPLPEQHAAVAEAIDRVGAEVIVTDPMLLGASMTAVLPREERPPVLMLGLSASWIADPRIGSCGSGVAPAEEGMNRLRAAAGELAAARRARGSRRSSASRWSAHTEFRSAGTSVRSPRSRTCGRS